ncbi:MAG TPA: BrnT family toxin [Thermoanaerobaculia bacterium]|nr:BrnT family toxin [Thermoanaerobaculia bacterium]
MRIVWDEPKRRTTLSKHGYDFADLSPDFFSDALVQRVQMDRQQAIALHAGRLVAVVFVPLGSEAVSVISVRRASRKERKAYEAQHPADH